jgi:hypothetical protein
MFTIQARKIAIKLVFKKQNDLFLFVHMKHLSSSTLFFGDNVVKHNVTGETKTVNFLKILGNAKQGPLQLPGTQGKTMK